MRRLLLILLFAPAMLRGQTFDGLSGKSYKEEKELEVLKNCRRASEKEDTGGYWCVVYQDSIKNMAVITIQRENLGISTILEVMEIAPPGKDKEIIAGIAERRESDAGYTFVVSIEGMSDGDGVKLATNKVDAAWAFNNKTRKFDKLRAKKVTRIGESFMWR